jgi:predicted Rdx family selenoprotein
LSWYVLPDIHCYGAGADSERQTYLPEEGQTKKVLLWDRKAESGFPGMFSGLGVKGNVARTVIETKVLKQLVRDHIDPERDLGHSDTHGKKKAVEQSGEQEAKKGEASEGVEVKRNPDGTVCEDCK